MSYEAKSNSDVFLSGGEKLTYTIYTPAEVENPPAMMLLHGSAAPAKDGTPGKGRVIFDAFQRILAEEGYASFAFDGPGVGDSKGDFRRGTLLRREMDAETALRVLLEMRVDRNRVFGFGLSMSGHVLAKLAGRLHRDFRGIVLVNPAAYPADATSAIMDPFDDSKNEFGHKIRREGVWKDSNAFRFLGDSKAKVLIFRSEKDDTVPEGVTDSYEAVARDRVTRLAIAGAPHAIMTGTDEAAKRFVYSKTIDFLKSLD